MNLQTLRNTYIKKVDETVKSFLESLDLAPHLQESLDYSYFAGGKRLRPLMLLSMIHAFNHEVEEGLHAAAALELIHTSSLIHDDLPAMDDDDYRRGKKTNHKVFGEATAILAGDSLLLDSFSLICNDERINDDIKIRLICELSECSGANGMVGGQKLDIENEYTKRSITIDELKTIHHHKTGKLLEFALVSGAIISKQSDDVIKTLKEVAYHIGIAYQIKDDILDIIGDESLIGKPVNSDHKNHKDTYVSLVGLEEAKKMLEFHYKNATTLIKTLNIQSGHILELFSIIINRNN
ncbi:polyprenyl synthetase family protein [Haloplasma contractile]|uniref:Geranylgeranyl diphosphate synthase type II protein n=1 Tax=Haloplasma contractile SSD-17B TaxID=1033810 RepID=U2FS42_9MOLU|nr:farnesyl diphosphate synthase [Haloplasma contractile]ERJ13774.1 geranylgeranyl diphosphate synthase type II protein [Haloplasma contractile SSD-17B]